MSKEQTRLRVEIQEIYRMGTSVVIWYYHPASDMRHAPFDCMSFVISTYSLGYRQLYLKDNRRG